VKRTGIIIRICILGIGILSGCNSLSDSNKPVAEGDVLLAAVEDRKMYLSEVKDMISPSSPEDSLAQLNTFIEAWLFRNVLLKEAEKNFPADLNIDKLIEDYRSSLILHNYRQKLLEKDLDTVITAAQEQAYYDENKDQFLLPQAICKARIVKIPDDAKRIDRFYRNWQKNDSISINEYIAANAIFDSGIDDEWHTVDHFLAFLPDKKFKVNDFSKKRDIQKHHEQYEYFIKVSDFKAKNELSPIAYIRDQMRKVIIHDRKKDLLEKIEKKLYQNYLSANKIKVFKK